MSTNLYKHLLSLLPADPVLTGRVELIFQDGTAQVELSGGAGRMRVRNPLKSALDSRVYVQSGAITGTAPEMQYVRIEV